MATILRLASCFYGDMVVAQTAEVDIDTFYTNSLDWILKTV